MKVSTAPTTFTEVAHWHGTSEEAASEGSFLNMWSYPPTEGLLIPRT